MNTLRYYLRDARDGIKRNAGASIATVLLICISLSITGAIFLLKAGADNISSYLSEQAKIKIFLKQGVSAQEVAKALQSKSFVKTAEAESKEKAMERFKALFKGKEHLLEAFQEGQFPDAVAVELKDKSQMAEAAAQLKEINGVEDVVSPQAYAEALDKWTKTADGYGKIALAVIALASFLTVATAIDLGMHQRQKDIRVKLLLGAKESHVRGQFLLEGWILGLLGGIGAMFAVYAAREALLSKIQGNFGGIFDFNSLHFEIAMLGIALAGSAIGIAGAYFSTRKMMSHA